MWDPSAVQTLLLSVLSLALIVAGIGLTARARRNDYADTARIGFNVLSGIIVAALGLGGIAFAAFGKQILTTLGFNVG